MTVVRNVVRGFATEAASRVPPRGRTAVTDGAPFRRRSDAAMGMAAMDDRRDVARRKSSGKGRIVRSVAMD